MTAGKFDPIDQRDELIERAKLGEISGEAADAEAIWLGLGSLSHTPGPEKFRPEAEPYWTIPMAVAWIAYLDLDEVREWYPPFRAACFHWLWQRWRRGPDGEPLEGWHLEGRQRATLLRLKMGALWDARPAERPQEMSIEEAQKALWLALREGFFAASGIDTETGRRVEIAPLDWNELQPFEGPGETDEVRRGPLASGYREVLVPSAKMRGYWRRVEKPTLVLPETMPPIGHGYMPLYCAAQWIATEGGRIQFDPTDLERWRHAYRELTAALSTDAVRAVGIIASETKPVPPHLFAGIRVNHPFEDMEIELMVSQELVLRSYPYVDEEHWLKGFDDALVDRRGDHWTRLMVDKMGVRAAWPFENTAPKSGAPGRPTSAHLFKAEMERRAKCGDLSPTLAAETRYLSKWLQDNHSTMPQARPGSIEEVIRTRYWELRSQN